MPIREYKARDCAQSCPHCQHGFEQLEQAGGSPMTTCPRCGNGVALQFSASRIGRSVSGFDDRAKGSGFHKYKRLGAGEYEKQY